jgi:hypothetical protein
MVRETSSWARVAFVLMSVSFGLPTAASAAPPVNDNFGQAAPLSFGDTHQGSTSEATIEPGEPYTANGLGTLSFCAAGSGKRTQQDRTLWWQVVGSGRPVTVSTAGSAEDTVLGAFTSLSSPFACNDDEATGVGSTWQSKLTFETVAGTVYRLQAGRCAKVISATPLHDCTDQPGTGIRIRADTAPPLNDVAAAAAPLPTGTPVAGDNYGASEEPGEGLVCASSGNLPYGRTVWYRWVAPAPGRAVFVSESAAGTVTAVWQGGRALGCAAGDASGSSSLDLGVQPGEYLVQVGGPGVHDPAALRDSASGLLRVRVDFAENPDHDGDGVPNQADCAPHDPARHPGARDTPRDRIDQDCNGRDAPLPSIATPRPLMSFVGSRPTLTLQRLPRGGRLTIRCTRCSNPVIRRAVGRSTRRLVLRRSVLGRWRAGAVIRVDVTAPRQVGHRWKWNVRRDGTPRVAGDCQLRPGVKPRC